jgi:hypothetical protein
VGGNEERLLTRPDRSDLDDVTDPAVELVEGALAAGRPFGDSGYVKDRLRVHYRRRLAMVADRCPPAQRLRALVDAATEGMVGAVLDTPVARAVIDDVVVRLRDGAELPDSDALRDRAFDELCSRIVASAADDGLPAPVRSRIWRARPAGAVDAYLEAVFEANLGDHLRPVAPATQDEEMIAAGARLLGELCPDLARSALAHVSVIAVVDRVAAPGFTSLTMRQLPGVLVLSPLVLGNPWQAAEFLLHEAMHLKFIDLEQTHSLTDGSRSAHTTPLVRPHWNRREDWRTAEWPLVRSLTVVHVYTSLALFFAVAHTRPDLDDRYGEGTYGDRARQSRRCLDRAEYLHHVLSTRAAGLGRAGQLFLDWIGSLHDLLDAEPRPRGGYAHLALDLYDRETQLLRSILARSGGATASSLRFRDRARAREIALSCGRRESAVLPELGGPAVAAPVAAGAGPGDPDGLSNAVAGLVDVRERVSAVVHALCARWRPDSVADADELALSARFLAVVEESGVELNDLLDELSGPPGPVGARGSS